MRVKFGRGITMFGRRKLVHWPRGSDHGLLLAVPMLREPGFTCVGYFDDSFSCFALTAEGNLNAQRAQAGLRPPQATRERARIFWPAAAGKAITGISDAKRKKFSGGPYTPTP
jgi:hypothetical protein